MKPGDLIRIPPRFSDGTYILFSGVRIKAGEHLIPGERCGRLYPGSIALVIDRQSCKHPMTLVLVDGITGWLPSYAEVEVVV